MLSKKNKSRVSKHIYTITVPAPKIKRTLICPTEFQTGVVRTGMGSVYKVDWSVKWAFHHQVPRSG